MPNTEQTATTIGSMLTALLGWITWWRKRDADEIARLDALVTKLLDQSSRSDATTDEVREALFQLQKSYVPVLTANAMMHAERARVVRLLVEVRENLGACDPHCMQLIHEMIAALSTDVMVQKTE